MEKCAMPEPGRNQNLLRKLPSVDALMQEPELRDSAAACSTRIVADSIRSSVETFRKQLLAQMPPDLDEQHLRRQIIDRAMIQIRRAIGPHYRRAVNATGIVLHTGLGRAVLPARAIRQIAEELAGYSLLQVDQETGERSRRDERIEWLLQKLTGCEAATVVNNNAAATAIVLNTVAKDKEVIVSRGQLVEIGGSFRLPEVMAAAGVKLVEVGATNKTHAKDYEAAITENTAAILRVHPSNYRIVGFAAEVPLEDLERIAHAHRLVLIDDVGAGALIDYSRFGFEKEPTLQESVQTGADIITSSTDKLIGGAQGGIVLGKASWIAAVRKNPLARILRVDKLTLAALEATLGLFFDDATALREIPTLQMLVRKLPELEEKARAIVRGLDESATAVAATIIDGFSQMGSGSLPGQNLPTRLVALHSDKIEAGELARRLRYANPPVITRVQKHRVLIDPRTLLNGEEALVVRAIAEIFQSP